MPAKRRQPASPAPATASERFIPGIHHYCNRWCERCEFSHRCMKFVLTEQMCGSDTAVRDSGTQTVFDALSRVFEEARRDLDKAASKLGVEVDDDSLRASIAVEKRIQRQARRTGARESKAALTCAHMTDEWFNNELKVPLQHVREMKKRVQHGTMSVAKAKGDLVRLNDCVEVIRWHQHLIYVKLCRAFSSRVEEGSSRAAQKDSDGSAKVALLSLDESIAAWGVMRDIFPEKTDSVLEILLQLDRLRKAVEKKFPKARKFKRPGFDESLPRKKPAAKAKPRKTKRTRK